MGRGGGGNLREGGPLGFRERERGEGVGILVRAERGEIRSWGLEDYSYS